MSLDIVEIALDYLTDHADFEKLAAEIMREEGFSNIKPLGGVTDGGIDAKQESFFSSEDRARVVFQFTLQESLACKIDETITKLTQAGIDYQLLVLATTRKISTERQEKMVQYARKNHSVTLNIYERKTLVNRLANFETGIFYRHFPDIETQIKLLSSRKALLSPSDTNLREESLLKAAITFVFSQKAREVRKSIFDYMVLAVLLKFPDKGIITSDLIEEYRRTLGGDLPEYSQISAAINRLESNGLVEKKEDALLPTQLAIETAVGSTIKADTSTYSLISDVLDQICNITESKLAEQLEQKISRNVRDVLIKLFQLFGIELSNMVLIKQTPSPVYLESSETLMQLAKRELPSGLGELLIAVLAQIIKSPTNEQAEVLRNWAFTYLGSQIMVLDPTLNEFQLTCFQKKIFILDTDFILNCVIKECPISGVYLDLVKNLRRLGCKLIVPLSCLKECTTHASIAPQTYHYFEEKLLVMPNYFIDEKVGNVFVKGYYYGCVSHLVPPRTSFAKYLSNYYEPKNSGKFFRDVIEEILPEGIEILDPSLILSEKIPENKLEMLTSALLELFLKSKKSEYRSEEENKDLAKSDARLFLTATYLNDRPEEVSGHILGGDCYLITASGRYLKSAKMVGIRDVVTTRPQSLVALLEFIGGAKITPTEFVGLFENPMLIYAVSQAWDDVKTMLENGIELQGKSLPRLKWDLDQALHSRITAVSNAEAKADEAGEKADLRLGDPEYIDLLKTASSLGYKRTPGVDSLINALEKSVSNIQEKDREYELLLNRFNELEKAIAFFGKKKQRYLRRIAHRKTNQ